MSVIKQNKFMYSLIIIIIIIIIKLFTDQYNCVTSIIFQTSFKAT